MRRLISRKAKNKQSQTVFQNLTLFFYDRPKLAAGLLLLIVAFGITSYTSLLKREGFPAIVIPYSFVNGPYLVNDSSQVDKKVAKPLSDLISKQPNVKTVSSSAGDNFFSVIIQYKEGTNASTANQQIEQAVKDANLLPAEAKPEFKTLSPGISKRGDDMLLVIYDKSNSTNTSNLTDKANEIAAYLKNQSDISLLSDASIIDPYVRGTDPTTGKSAVSQTSFERYAKRTSDQTTFYKSVDIGLKGIKGFDVLKLDDQVNKALTKLNADPKFNGYSVAISYSGAPSIKDQISNLQQSLLEGLAAVLIVSAIMIALRASLITVTSMAVVITATLGILYLIGYSLNTITLFSLVLCLSLIVDDTIIMVEAIDSQRRKLTNPREVISTATKKISRAMLAATLTASLGFAPLIFVGGILGSFIRAIPITVIASLLVSLVVALIFIPFLSHYVLLTKKQLGREEDGQSPAHHLEIFIAKTITRPIMWANHHRKRQVGLGITALIVGFGFIIAGGLLFQKVTFNIFAPNKDSDQIAINITFPPNTSINNVEKTADEVDQITANQLGVNFKDASYYSTANPQTASLYIDLLSFKKRSVKSPELIDQLNATFANYHNALVVASQIDAGPPASGFGVLIQTDNLPAAYKASGDISKFLASKELKRPNGKLAHFKSVVISNPNSITRKDGRQFVKVSADFDGTDTSTLVLLAQSAVKDEFNNSKMASYGLSSNDLNFDIGQESDNQNSFKTLLLAFPILLVVIYLLLITQFKSLLQPALIFMAIPFSFFGITTGLWLTHNSFSFFTMLGFFALIGLSIKNTILLTDYANQAKKAGATSVESVAISLQERFRPLIATSITAITSLIPLYLSNPFWEGLAVTLMFGLLSSTFLVITVFPYYYLGAEYLRLKIRRRSFFGWLVVYAILAGAAIGTKHVKFIPIALILSLVIWLMLNKYLISPKNINVKRKG